MEEKVNAVMLRSIDYGENDKILTLLTAEKGKITAGIKGVKKAGARLKFAAQPFCFAEYVLASKSGKYTVIGCSETESFYDLRTDILKFYAASAVAEAALSLTFEGDVCRDIFYKILDTYSKMCVSGELCALLDFLVFALAQAGYAITAENCPYCGKSLLGGDKLRFDMHTGVFCCYDCGKGVGASGITFNAIRKALGKSHSDENACQGEKRALRLIREFFIYKTDCRLKSLSEYLRLL